jgi:hypothetical protein
MVPSRLDVVLDDPVLHQQAGITYEGVQQAGAMAFKLTSIPAGCWDRLVDSLDDVCGQDLVDQGDIARKRSHQVCPRTGENAARDVMPEVVTTQVDEQQGGVEGEERIFEVMPAEEPTAIGIILAITQPGHCSVERLG